jgi:uncharacterized repeat protein (TIGR03837 family)
MTVSCDLFCAVVDNLGDAAVCWRLARQLAAEHDWAMRLWIDDQEPLALLRPGIDPRLERQIVDGVELRHWSQPFPNERPADVVIEAFACELPQTFVESMAKRLPRPVWLNLEYLSAEEWVAGCHGLSSPHPRLPLVKHFFFPGFEPGTGGLIRESNLAPAPHRNAGGDLTVSLFCYDNPALPALLDTWSKAKEPLRCLVTEGSPRHQVESWLGTPFPPGAATTQGRLSLEALPFLPQTAYDALLADCDLNFVRGEDSFVRAQWAERPFVWQIYPQAHGSHQTKLSAFLTLYGQALPAAAHEALLSFWQAWNGIGDPGAAWAAFRSTLPALEAQATPWAARISRQGNLVENLANFCLERI